jgi:hypothetical protein
MALSPRFKSLREGSHEPWSFCEVLIVRILQYQELGLDFPRNQAYRA